MYLSWCCGEKEALSEGSCGVLTEAHKHGLPNGGENPRIERRSWEPIRQCIINYIPYTMPPYATPTRYHTMYRGGRLPCPRRPEADRLQRGHEPPLQRAGARLEEVDVFQPGGFESQSPTLLLMVRILHDLIFTILPEVLGHWHLKSCRISIINSTPSH